MKSDYAEGHCNLANTLKELGKLKGAEVSYRQAIALKSDYAEAHKNFGGLLMLMGQYREGLNEKIISDGIISFDLKNGLAIA